MTLVNVTDPTGNIAAALKDTGDNVYTVTATASGATIAYAKTNQEWVGDGKGNSKTYQSEIEHELGDNGAYRVAREMENGNGKYIKGKGWQ